MVTQPMVTIIVPVYNREDYLRQCVVSIIDQMLKEIAVVFVDDVSTDASRTIPVDYALTDEGIELKHQQNQEDDVRYDWNLSAVKEYLRLYRAENNLPPRNFGGSKSTMIRQII